MGKTIMISSHILHELSELCDTVGIIEQGVLIFSGSVGEIMARASIGQIVHITVEDRVEEAVKLLEEINGVMSVEVTPNDGTHGDRCVPRRRSPHGPGPSGPPLPDPDRSRTPRR